MKKFLITLLMMAVVLVGVFAATSTGDATLIVTTKINALEPTFRLATDQVFDDLGGDAGTLSNAHVITADALLAGDESVTFFVKQISMSRSVKTYTLSATATDLVLYKYKNPSGGDVLVSATPHPATDAEKKFEVDATTVNTFANGDLADAKATYGGTTSSKTITYKGNAQQATEVAPVTVASFICTWGQNENAVTGDYQATITLTIAST